MPAGEIFFRVTRGRLGCRRVAGAAGQPGVTAVIAGPRTLRQLHDNLEGFSLTLPPDALARLSDIPRPAGLEPVTGTGAHR
jgi:hypothetical protein